MSLAENAPLDLEAQRFLTTLSLSDEEFEGIRALVYKNFGIHLNKDKRSLVSGRLQKVVKAHGLASFQEYCKYVEEDLSGAALEELAERISTNHTFFFRERDHFDFFVNTALPEAVERHERANARDLRIWCAGCSSGEEPYTLVMLMLEYFGREYISWQAGVLATDISARALDSARSGIYSEERMDLMPEKFRQKYFRRAAGGQWAICEQVKREVTFRSLNLMSHAFPFKQPFDLVFCRNVMIYFDPPTRDALVRRFYTHTAPGGYLFIGHSESLRRESCPYNYLAPALYQKGEL